MSVGSRLRGEATNRVERPQSSPSSRSASSDLLRSLDSEPRRERLGQLELAARLPEAAVDHRGQHLPVAVGEVDLRAAREHRMADAEGAPGQDQLTGRALGAAWYARGSPRAPCTSRRRESAPASSRPSWPARSLRAEASASAPTPPRSATAASTTARWRLLGLSGIDSLPGLLDEPDPELGQLLGGHVRGGAAHRIDSRLVLRERDHVAEVRLARRAPSSSGRSRARSRRAAARPSRARRGGSRTSSAAPPRSGRGGRRPVPAAPARGSGSCRRRARSRSRSGRRRARAPARARPRSAPSTRRSAA